MGKSQTQRNRNQRQCTFTSPTAGQTGPNSSAQTSVSSQQGTSAHRSAKSPPPSKRISSIKDNVLSNKQQGKLPESEPTGIDLERRLAQETYGPSSPTAPPNASLDASQHATSPEPPIQEIDMQV